MKKPHSIHAAKTHFCRLVKRAEAGEEIVIVRGNTPVARLAPLREPIVRRQFGVMRGRAKVTRAFFERLPPEDLKSWEG